MLVISSSVASTHLCCGVAVLEGGKLAGGTLVTRCLPVFYLLSPESHTKTSLATLTDETNEHRDGRYADCFHVPILEPRKEK
jgi:hypothetical protein